MSYLKLVHMEVHRFRWVIAALMGITAIFQFGGLIATLASELSRREYRLPQDIGNSSIPAPAPDLLTFEWAMFNTQLWFILPMLLSMAVLGLYVFIIWYRDWIGRSTFIYRLLMLPSARRNLYFAKLTAFLLFVFGMVSFQLALLPIEHLVFKLVVPADLRADSHIVDVIGINQALAELIPRKFEQFLYSYGLGTIVVLAIFTAILLERSYRGIGILYGLLYLGACALAVAFPIIFLGVEVPYTYFYPAEVYAIELAMCALVGGVSVWLGTRLLARKITV
ncbi:hypothetical protein [Paenibacillus arenilitoris]|uniref:Uncharacterized protein n=1 Tax=Paenibacillus arenilitoris TaxID=2772299 RepID=A0A927CPJ3_9BACL|nr:hypothetical protein [Paenibacillus arenilitoris]MBD2871359.1 hypothetical protein [Paenibacillus arenilitoris]